MRRLARCILGATALFGLVSDGPALGASSVPDAVHAARATRRWLVEGDGFDPSSIDSTRHRVYLFDDEASVPFAADTATGARVWKAKLPQTRNGRRKGKDCSLDRTEPAGAVLRLAHDVLVVENASTLAGYDLETGERLWFRRSSCGLKEARGDFARLACDPAEAIIVARLGKAVLNKAVSFLEEEFLLGTNALLRISRKGRSLSSRPLRPPGPSWSIKLAVKGDELGLANRLVVAEAVVVFLGSPMLGIDPGTGRVLWQAREPGCDQAVAVGQELRLLCADRVQTLDLATGKERARTSLPCPRRAGSPLALTGDGERLVLVEAPSSISAEERIFVWAPTTGSWTVLRRPALTVTFGWDRNLLIAAASHDGVVLGLDPAAQLPALASLPPEAAIRAIVDDAGPTDHHVVYELMTISGLGPALVPTTGLARRAFVRRSARLSRGEPCS